MAQTVGIAFYTKETYKEPLKRAEDAEKLHQSYKDWWKSAQELQNQLKQMGLKTEFYPIDLETLRLWLLQHDLPNTGSSRSRFVSEKSALKA